MRRKGFTLIELLVVIAIIAILAAILFPVFERVQRKAKGAACMNNLKQMATATLMYAHDWDQTLPLYIQPVPLYLNPSTGTETQAAWGGKKGWLWPYIQSEDVYYCPSIGMTKAGWGGTHWYYGYLANGWGQASWVNDPKRTWAAQPLDYFNYPSHLVTFAEGGYMYIWHNELRGSVVQGFGDGAFVNFSELVYMTKDPPLWGRYECCNGGGIKAPHGAAANCAFMDGHVAAIDLPLLKRQCTYYFDSGKDASGPNYWNGTAWVTGPNGQYIQ